VIAAYGGRRQAQAVTAQASFYSVNDPRLHFGLGRAESVDLEVRWPSGRVDQFPKQPSNVLIVIQEGKGVIGAEPLPS
jgi:enediyne biosynthesis protein E4